MSGKKVLVTGGSGFLAMYIILQLLNKGYEVKTTVRSLNKKNSIIETLEKNNVNHIERLSFAEADLSSDEHWNDVMQDCDYVLSVASPVFFHHPKNEEEVIKPAKDGIIRILKAAENADIKRVVMTSNFGAVGFSKKSGVTTEADWTDVNEKGLSVYEKSKLLAEKAAWEYADAHHIELATVNPVAILGPSMGEHVTGSFGLVKNLLNGEMSRIPNIPLNVVDVRDVADIHIRAMETPEAAGKRFIASSDGQISMPEIAQLLKAKRPEISNKVTDKRVPDWVLSVGALFNAEAKEGKLLLTMNRNVSNKQAKEILGWTPISTKEEAVLHAADSLKKYKLI